MTYVDSSLMPGELVVHRAKLHKILFFIPALLTVAFLGLTFWVITKSSFDQSYAGVTFVLAIIVILPAYIEYCSSEFAVTNRRVIVKVGFIRRRTLETLLQKIEAISVDQSILGRILNYGTVTVIGTGGTNESFQNIADPLTFRRAVQEQSLTKDR